MADQQNENHMLDGARNAAQEQADQAIDQFAGRVPGGKQFSQQAKDAVGGILNNLEHEGENRLGGMTGGIVGNQGQQSVGQHNQAGQTDHSPLAGGRQMAEQQVDQAIDSLADKIPGGKQFSQQAKDAADGVLNNLENELEQRLGNAGGLLGGLFGHHDDKKQ
jgi:hypothetical protein